MTDNEVALARAQRLVYIEMLKSMHLKPDPKGLMQPLIESTRRQYRVMDDYLTILVSFAEEAGIYIPLSQ